MINEHKMETKERGTSQIRKQVVKCIFYKLMLIYKYLPRPENPQIKFPQTLYLYMSHDTSYQSTLWLEFVRFIQNSTKEISFGLYIYSKSNFFGSIFLKKTNQFKLESTGETFNKPRSQSQRVEN